jgi:hypothetical protein
MRRDARIYWHIFASIIIFSLHLTWLTLTVKWTYPGYFFISYSVLLLLALLLIKTVKLNVGAVYYIFMGIFFGLLASIAAWFISNSFFAPYRFDYFLHSPHSIFDFVKLALFTSTVTGGWIVGGAQGYILHHFNLVKKTIIDTNTG